MLSYRIKIQIKYTNPSANCATGVCVCVCVTMISHLGAPTATGGGAADPGGVLSAFAPGSSTGERTRRSSWEQEICLQLRRCPDGLALPCPDGLRVGRENVGRWCRPITPALQYRKSWICLEHFSCFFRMGTGQPTQSCRDHKHLQTSQRHLLGTEVIVFFSMKLLSG